MFDLTELQSPMTGPAGTPAESIPASLTGFAAAPAAKTGGSGNPVSGGLADVLFEQLAYLIQFSDREPRRLARVTAILLEAFN